MVHHAIFPCSDSYFYCYVTCDMNGPYSNQKKQNKLKGNKWQQLDQREKLESCKNVDVSRSVILRF